MGAGLAPHPRCAGGGGRPVRAAGAAGAQHPRTAHQSAPVRHPRLPLRGGGGEPCLCAALWRALPHVLRAGARLWRKPGHCRPAARLDAGGAGPVRAAQPRHRAAARPPPRGAGGHAGVPVRHRPAAGLARLRRQPLSLSHAGAAAARHRARAVHRAQHPCHHRRRGGGSLGRGRLAAQPHAGDGHQPRRRGGRQHAHLAAGGGDRLAAPLVRGRQREPAGGRPHQPAGARPPRGGGGAVRPCGRARAPRLSRRFLRPSGEPEAVPAVLLLSLSGDRLMRVSILAITAATLLATPVLAQTAPRFATVPAAAAMSETLTDLDVYNGAGEKVGEIEDVVINGKDVVGYVLSVGGFLGMGERYVVVSPDSVAVTYTASDKKWHAKMDATKDQVKAAPEYKYDAKHKS
ncbi:MAG: hypothetical protein B7Y70_16335 [Rhizobiales bacterium 35-68-8]|nr:MAG: hypothetical protein B7Y70_16335 [Rhizobiales bacterium 35-68-8]